MGISGRNKTDVCSPDRKAVMWTCVPVTLSVSLHVSVCVWCLSDCVCVYVGTRGETKKKKQVWQKEGPEETDDGIEWERKAGQMTVKGSLMDRI